MRLLEKYKKQAAVFVQVCKRLSRNGYVTGHGGNLAWRLDDNVILITATCLAKGEHRPADLVFINLDGKVLEGRRKPTGELPLYLTLFRKRPDIRSVIHCHPPCCCAWAATGGENLLMRPVFPEVIIEVGPVPVVPYATPLTEALAGNFEPFLQRYNAFLMENHGVILVTQRDIRWACGLVEELETAADSLLRARSLGLVKSISKEHLAEIDKILTIRSLPMCGAPGVNKSLVDLYYPNG